MPPQFVVCCVVYLGCWRPGTRTPCRRSTSFFSSIQTGAGNPWTSSPTVLPPADAVLLNPTWGGEGGISLRACASLRGGAGVWLERCEPRPNPAALRTSMRDAAVLSRRCMHRVVAWLPLLTSYAAPPWRGWRRCGRRGVSWTISWMPDVERRLKWLPLRPSFRSCTRSKSRDLCDVLWFAGASPPRSRSACRAVPSPGTPVAPAGLVVLPIC